MFQRIILSMLALVFCCASDILGQTRWRATDVVAESEVKRCGADAFFSAEAISDSVYAVMHGRSMPDGCPVKRSDLRYLRVLHRNGKGQTQVGEMVCNKAIAADLLYIFRQLYDKGYPIERMVLIDNYAADDETSMAANNSSCFCYRAVNGTTKISAHGRGMAVDINPLYNPCVRTRQGVTMVEPKAGRKYVSRKLKGDARKYLIDRESLPYKLFRERGFEWGGSWKSLKDYQHFEK